MKLICKQALSRTQVPHVILERIWYGLDMKKEKIVVYQAKNGAIVLHADVVSETIWATKTVRSHIVDGYTIDPARIALHHKQFLKVIDDVKKTLPADTYIQTGDVLELIKTFAETWFSLDAYDKQIFPKTGIKKKNISCTADELREQIGILKNTLINRKEATELLIAESDPKEKDRMIGLVLQLLVFAK